MSHGRHPLTLRAVLLVLAWFPLVLTQGCSFSASSKSSSDSSTSSSESSTSSSRSSSAESGEARYREDVREYTAASVRTGGQLDAFRRGLGDLARKHGITNWEESPLTYEGIGEGLRQARASETLLQAYQDGLAGQDAAKRAAMQKGYEAKRG